jgi:uncharacterized membrane protein YkvA (DUF1232 family)
MHRSSDVQNVDIMWSMTTWLLVGVAAAIVVYGAVIVALLVAGRRTHARAWAGFLPDCVVLVRRLHADPRVPRSRKVLLWLLLGYLALPIDLVPDFLPVIGQLDDAIVVAVVLRLVLRAGGEQALADHWPGPQPSLVVVRRLAFGRGEPASSA